MRITYTDPQDIADKMDDPFITVGKKTSRTIPKYDDEKDEELELTGQKQNPTFKLQTIEEEVRKYIKKIKEPTQHSTDPSHSSLSSQNILHNFFAVLSVLSGVVSSVSVLFMFVYLSFDT